MIKENGNGAELEGNGATLEWTDTGNARLFAVGPASIGAVSGTGNLTLRNVYVKGFHVKGGDGADAGGGGMGALPLDPTAGGAPGGALCGDSAGVRGNDGGAGQCPGGDDDSTP